jgi:hypothetical protein
MLHATGVHPEPCAGVEGARTFKIFKIPNGFLGRLVQTPSEVSIDPTVTDRISFYWTTPREEEIMIMQHRSSHRSQSSSFPHAYGNSGVDGSWSRVISMKSRRPRRDSGNALYTVNRYETKTRYQFETDHVRIAVSDVFYVSFVRAVRHAC